MGAHHTLGARIKRSSPTTILLKYVCLSQLANCRSQFLLGRSLKLFVSTESTSYHELASQFGQAILYTPKTLKNYREDRVSHTSLLIEPASQPSKRSGDGRSITSDNMSGDNSDHSGDRLSQNGEKQPVKMATTRMYTFTA